VRRKIYLWKKADIYKIKEDLELFGNTFRNIGKRDIEECLVGFDWILSIYDGLFFPVDIR
jgi:hypothetical protein